MPASPENVRGSAPDFTPRRTISANPLVISAPRVLSPKPRPSSIPAASAITFFKDPANSTPTISFVVYTRKLGVRKRFWTFSANSILSDATVTAVGISRATSSACDGPDNVQIPDLISDSQDGYAVILVDCLTLWVSNLLMASGDDVERVKEGIEHLADCLATIRTTVVLVSNEVGLGIVPESRLARSFRDLAGALNQRVAEKADRVVFMVAGMPCVLKG